MIAAKNLNTTKDPLYLSFALFWVGYVFMCVIFPPLILLLCIVSSEIPKRIARELAALTNRINLANEKGWRREYPLMMFLAQFRLLTEVENSQGLASVG